MKHKMDLGIERDFSVILNRDFEYIKNWIKYSNKMNYCPLGDCIRCQIIFPEIKKPISNKYYCPCGFFHIKDVMIIAKRIIELKNNK